MVAGVSSASRYEVIRRLGVGGMGEVFLCRQDVGGLRRLVVQKRLLPEAAEQEDLVSLFLDEARITAQLRHPSIVQVYDFGHDHDGYFLTMEYVAGQNLGRVLLRALRDQHAISRPLAAYIVLELARALEYAHTATDVDGQPLGIVHRDISPSNLMLSYSGDIKLMDFGIAKSHGRMSRTRTGAVRGKLEYMSPEQLSGAVVDARTDVFSTGVLLWELTLMRRLFKRETEMESINAVMSEPIPLPTTVDPTYPPELERVVVSALKRDRGSRLANAAGLVDALKGYLANVAADREAVAALMCELFPEDGSASRNLVRVSAAPRPPTAPTVSLESEPPVTVPDAVRPDRSRAVWMAAGASVACGVLIAAIVSRARRHDIVPARDAELRSSGSETEGSAVEIAMAAPPADAAMAISAAAQEHPSAPTRPHQHGSSDSHRPTHEAALPPAEPGQVYFKAQAGMYYRPVGLRCSLDTTPTTCALPAGAQHVSLAAADGKVVMVNVSVVSSRRVVCTVTPQGASCGEPR